MSEGLEDNIRESATGPAKASGDSGSVEQHPLPDQIAADRYLASKQASQGRKLGIVLKKLSPPGAD